MEPMLCQATRWCPTCESPGTPIMWGYPTEMALQQADQGRVILGGCVVTEPHPSHLCDTCGTEFIAANRLYKRQPAGTEVYGVAVWPHGRRSVRVEANDGGWTVMVDGEGSMLINRHAMTVIPNNVFEGMWPWEVQSWATKRGFPAQVELIETGASLRVGEAANLFELLLIKTWWRSLGRSPLESAIDRLSSEASSPIWLPKE